MIAVTPTLPCGGLTAGLGGCPTWRGLTFRDAPAGGARDFAGEPAPQKARYVNTGVQMSQERRLVTSPDRDHGDVELQADAPAIRASARTRERSRRSPSSGHSPDALIALAMLSLSGLCPPLPS